MERKKGLPSYPGSRSLYITLILLILFEAAAIVLQAIFLARSVTFLFQGAAVQTIGKDVRFFLLFFLLRHALSHLQQVFAERFAIRTTTALREKLVVVIF